MSADMVWGVADSTPAFARRTGQIAFHLAAPEPSTLGSYPIVHLLTRPSYLGSRTMLTMPVQSDGNAPFGGGGVAVTLVCRAVFRTEGTVQSDQVDGAPIRLFRPHHRINAIVKRCYHNTCPIINGEMGPSRHSPSTASVHRMEKFIVGAQGVDNEVIGNGFDQPKRR